MDPRSPKLEDEESDKEKLQSET